jgi:hypothetical protein
MLRKYKVHLELWYKIKENIYYLWIHIQLFIGQNQNNKKYDNFVLMDKLYHIELMDQFIF